MDELRNYVMQFTFRTGLTKKDDKPFWCMCPKCFINGKSLFDKLCYYFCCLFIWDMLKHYETSDTITSFDIYPKFKDV